MKDNFNFQFPFENDEKKKSNNSYHFPFSHFLSKEKKKSKLSCSVKKHRNIKNYKIINIYEINNFFKKFLRHYTNSSNQIRQLVLISSYKILYFRRSSYKIQTYRQILM